MTEPLFREDAYLTRDGGGRGRRAEPRGIVLDATSFYAQGGGQSGDQGDAVARRTGRAIADRQHDLRRRPRDHPACAGRGRRAARARARGSSRGSTGICATSACAPIPRCICSRSSLPYPVTGGSVGDARGAARFRFRRRRARQGRDRERLNELIATDAAVEPTLDHRRGARGQSGPRQDHVGQAADGQRAACACRDRGPRSAALRRHACRAHRRDRPRRR